MPLDLDDDDRQLDDVDVAWEFEPEPEPVRRTGVDPLLARFGALAVILTLAVPVVLGATSNSSDDQVRTAAAAPADAASTTSAQTPSIPSPAAVPSPTVAAAGAADQPAAGAPTTDTTPVNTESSTPTSSPAAVADSTEAISAELVTADTEPPTTAVPCGSNYELAAGDYWIRIADAADVSLADLLAVNDATVDTLLSPGGSICLPAGARTPAPPPVPETSPPTTNAPTTTSRPATTAPPATTPPATAPPATSPPVTTPPATTTPAVPPASSVTAAQAEAIIRSVWPDELEDRAVEIAMRESNLRPNVKNYCCYGLFQIYWSVHRRWLEPIGITSAADLYDPTTNARAAYALYQRSGSFGPWGG